MKLGSRRFKRSGKKTRNGWLRESDEDASSVLGCVHSYQRGQSCRRNWGDQSNVRQMFFGFAGAVAHHGLGLLRMGTMRQAAHHGSGGSLAGHAPGDWSERNGQKSHDREDGVGAAHHLDINTARLPGATAAYPRQSSEVAESTHQKAQDLPQRALRLHREHGECLRSTSPFQDQGRTMHKG